MRKLIVALALVAFMGVGCAGKDATLEEKLQSAEAVIEFARANDMAGSVSVTIGGDISAYQKLSFGLDTDVTVQANMQFNAADPDPE